MNFDQAINVILKHEGVGLPGNPNGYVNNPHDIGGPTVFGISMKFLKDNHIQPADVGLPNYNLGCMKLLTLDTAKKLYKTWFWDKLNLDKVTDLAIGTKIFDAACNMGLSEAGILAQKAANDLGSTLTVDGSLGPKSLTEINSKPSQAFVNAYSKEMANHYHDIVNANPSQAVFLKGWLDRAAWGSK